MGFFMTDSSVKLSSLKKGELFTLSNHDGEEVQARHVYIRDEYDRSTKKYVCVSFDDISHSGLLKGSTRVFINFIF